MWINRSLCRHKFSVNVGKIPRSLIVGTFHETVFSFVINWQTIFQGGGTILHSQQWWMGLPAAPCSYQLLASSFFWILTVLINMSGSLKKNKDKGKILKATREKQQITYKGSLIRLSADFLTETLWTRREWHHIFKVMYDKTNTVL